MLKRICVFLICVLVVSAVSGCDNAERNRDTVANISSGTESETVSDLSDAQEKSAKSDSVYDKSHGTSENASDEELTETMSANERREINAFLSKFSEAQYGIGEFYKTEDMINFAFVYNCINNSGFEKSVKDGKFVIPAALVDSTLREFYGKTVLHETPGGSKMWKYENGNFAAPVFTEKSKAYFTTVTSVHQKKDGMYEVGFHVYFNANDSFGNVDPTWYDMTSSEASQYFEFCYDGVAVIEHNDNAFRLISYETN